MNSLIKITFSTTTNQDSGLMTLANIRFLPLHIRFSVLLMLNLHWKFLAFSSIYLKHLIEFDIPTSTPRRIHVDSTSILRRYIKGQISTNLHVISTYFFDVISLIEKSTSFPCTFFDVFSMVEKSTSFPRTFFGVISLVEKYTSFPHTLFNVISMVEKSTSFPRTLFGVISLVKNISGGCF